MVGSVSGKVQVKFAFGSLLGQPYSSWVWFGSSDLVHLQVPCSGQYGFGSDGVRSSMFRVV